MRYLTAAAFLLAAIPALAADQPARVQSMLDSMMIGRANSVSFLDENGSPMTAEEFLRQSDAGKVFGAMKKMHKDGPPDVVFRLASKEALAAMQAAPAAKLKAGDAFPEFRLARLDGTVVDNKSLAGRYTLVNFYFALCAPCVKEVPDLNALAKARPDINYLAVTFDPVAESTKFVADTGFNWPVLPDARKLTTAAGIKGYPSMILLDPQGKVVEVTAATRVTAGGGTFGGWLDKHIGAPK